MKIRRCVVCTLPLSEHKPKWLALRGYRMHQFDPGERRRVVRRAVDREAKAA